MNRVWVSKTAAGRCFAAAVGCSALLLLASCGGSSGSSTSTVADTLAPSDTAAVATTEAPASTSVAAAVGDSNSEFCNRARQLRTGFNPFGDIAGGTDPASLKTHFEAGTVVFNGLNEVRPDAVAGDMDLVKNAITAFHAGAERLNWDIIVIAQDAQLAAYMSDGSVNTALDRVHAYLLDVCGVSPTFGT